MYKILLLLILLMPMAYHCAGQVIKERFVGADSSIQNFWSLLSGTGTLQQIKDSTYWKGRYKDVYFMKFGTNRNNGTPTSITWFDASGKMMRSPLDSIKRVKYTDTASMLAPYLKTAVAMGMFLTTQNVYGADTGIMKVGTEPTAKFKINTSAVMMAQRAEDSIVSIKSLISGSYYNKSQADGRFYPLSSNPSNYLTSVPAQSFSSLTGKPTTLSGYGITDAYPLSGNPSGFLTNITSGQVTGALGFTPVSQAGARSAISLTTTGTSGAATYDNSTGVLNVPQYGSGNGTVTSVGITSTDFTVSGSPVTTSGNITANLATSGVSAGTYEFLTVNTKGIVTGGYNSSSSTLSSRTFGTAYQASNTSRIFDLDFTIRIAIGATLISASDGQVVLETSINGTTGWTEYTRSQNSNGSILGALNSQTVQIVALNLPAGIYYRLQPTTNSGTVTNTYITGHEILRR